MEADAETLSQASVKSHRLVEEMGIELSKPEGSRIPQEDLQSQLTWAQGSGSQKATFMCHHIREGGRELSSF